jgi:hypothetical protein
VVCLAPRALDEIVRPRRLAGVVSRPLNFTVRRMNTASTHRVIELLIGLALLGYCAYEIYTGKARGAYRSYDRSEEPWSYWTSMVFKLGITAVFLLGYTAWRS